MKKLITLTLITALLGIMSNCSPKTAKTTAKSEPKPKTESVEEPSQGNATGNNRSSETSLDEVVKLAQGGRSNMEQIAILSQSNDTRVSKGQSLYQSTCKQCHDLHQPSSRSADAWVEIMKVMGPKAKVDQATYLMISSYLVKNAGK